MSRPMRRLVIDGIDLDPTSILADDFLVDYEAGKVMLTIRFDNLHVSYEEAPPSIHVVAGEVVRAKPYGRDVRVLEVLWKQHWDNPREPLCVAVEYVTAAGPEFPRVLPLSDLGPL